MEDEPNKILQTLDTRRQNCRFSKSGMKIILIYWKNTPSTLTTKNYDSILKETSNWISTNDLHKKIGTDKIQIIESCKTLLSMGYLKTNPKQNKLFYRKENKAQSEFDFTMLMNIFEMNQKTELHNLSQLSSIMRNDGKGLRQKCLDVLEHVNEEVKRANMIKTKLDYQKKSSLISTSIADERIKKLDMYIEKIMNAVTSKNKDDVSIKAIQTYFKQHVIKFEEFKI